MALVTYKLNIFNLKNTFKSNINVWARDVDIENLMKVKIINNSCRKH